MLSVSKNIFQSSENIISMVRPENRLRDTGRNDSQNAVKPSYWLSPIWELLGHLYLMFLISLISTKQYFPVFLSSASMSHVSICTWEKLGRISILVTRKAENSVQTHVGITVKIFQVKKHFTKVIQRYRLPYIGYLSLIYVRLYFCCLIFRCLGTILQYINMRCLAKVDNSLRPSQTYSILYFHTAMPK